MQKRRKGTPLRTHSLDKTEHCRLPDEEEMEDLLPEAKPKRKKVKSVRFSDLLAVDIETGEEFCSYARLRECFETVLGFGLLSPMDEVDAESSFWKKHMLKQDKGASSEKRNRAKNIIVRGWHKLHNRLSPAPKQKRQEAAVTA